MVGQRAQIHVGLLDVGYLFIYLCMYKNPQTYQGKILSPIMEKGDIA